MHDERPGNSHTAGRLRQRSRRWLLQTALAALLAPGAASAAGADEADARALRAVIEAQLQAFAASDAERAFAFASPSIRAQFGDAATFMAMVQSAYPMLIRPSAISFFQPMPSDGAVWQRVQVRDRAGRLWLATYQLQREASEAWRINGCAVVPDTGKSTT
jgi:Domain of unknown function (DUF4864)